MEKNCKVLIITIEYEKMCMYVTHIDKMME